MAEETKIIRIVVDSSKAVDGSAAATRAMDKLERSMASMDGTLGRMERGLTSLGGMVKAQLALMLADLGARFVQMGKDSLNAVAGLDELAEQLGITTTGLQALQFSAVQNGVKLEQLETGISKFSQKMGEAANGSKDMVEALTDLGVKNLDVQGKLRPTEALLQEVAAAIAKMEDPAKRSAAAVDFFGKAGARMLPMLADIASGTDAMAASAQAAGAMIDGTVIKQLDKMSDEAEKSGLKMRALFAELGAPIITTGLERVNGLLGQIADQLQRGKASGDGFWATVLNDSRAQGQIGSGPNALKLATPAEMEAYKRSQLEKELANQWNPDSRAHTQSKLDKLNSSGSLDRQISMLSEEEWARRIPLPASFTPPGARTSAIKGAGQGEADKIAKLLRDNGRELDAANAYAEASERGAKAVADLETHFKALKAAQDAYGTTADKNAGQVAALTKKIEEQMQAAERAKSLKDFNLGTEELERTNQLLAAENALINANAEDRARELAIIRVKNEVAAKGLDASNEKERQAIERRTEAVTQNERLKAQADELKRANELWTEPLKNALNSIQTTAADMFDSMLERGAFSFQELGNFAQKMVRRMIAEFMALAVIRPMLGSLMGGLQGLGIVSPSTASSLGYGGSSSAGGMGGGLSLPSFGGGSMFSGLGDWLNTPFTGAYAGMSPSSMQGVPMLSGSAGAGITPLGALGAAAGIGMGAYQLATSKSTAGTIGGIGSMIGAGLSLVPGMAPIGMGISILSSILPSLFGGGEAPPLPPLAGSNLRFNPGAGGYSAAESFQNGGASQMGQYGNVAGTINALYAATGGTVNYGLATGGAIWNNQREGTTSTYAIHPTQGSVQLSEGEGDQSAAVDAMIAKMFYMTATTPGALTGISPTLGTALGNKETTSVAQIQALLGLVDAYDKLGKQTVSAKDALDQINAQFAGLTAGANEYGLSLAPIIAEQKKVTARYAQDFIDGMLDPLAVQMRALDDQRKDSIASAEYIRDNVKDVYVDMARITEYWVKRELDLKEQAYAASANSLQALIRRLTYGDLANATADMSYDGTRGTYQATLTQARAGSGTALNNLAGTAEAYATAGRSYFASGPEYAALVAQMRRDLLEVTGSTGGGTGGAGAANTNVLAGQMSEVIAAFEASERRSARLEEQVSALVAQLARTK